MVLVLIGIDIVGGGNYMRATIMRLLCQVVGYYGVWFLLMCKILFCLLGWRVWVMRWMTLLWQEMRSPFMWEFLHLDRRCGHVSLSLVVHCMHLGFEWVWGQNRFLLGT